MICHFLIWKSNFLHFFIRKSKIHIFLYKFMSHSFTNALCKLPRPKASDSLGLICNCIVLDFSSSVIPLMVFFMFSYGSYITGLNFACFQEGGERLEDVSCSGKTKKLQIFLDKIAVISDNWLPVCGFFYPFKKELFC